MKRLALIIAALVIAAAGVTYVLVQRVHAPFRGYAGAEQSVEIPTGLGTASIGKRLVAAGIIRDQLTYRLAIWMSGDARHLQAGAYRFDHPMTAAEVIAQIARGEVDRVLVTFPEGLTIAEMAAIFEAAALGPATDFVAAAQNVAWLDGRDPEAHDLEGYLFPDTYSLPRHADATPLVRMMVDRFKAVAGEAVASGAPASGLTTRQLVTLASIVEKETSRPDERPMVAGVYLNRLRLGMALQCDPTVIYALQRAGTYHGNLRREDLALPSPYNTYRYPGLPPGPIAAPGKSSLEAAGHPAPTDYLYFVSRNDGSHEFARTLADHNRNVQKYQVQYFRERRTVATPGAGGAGGAGRAAAGKPAGTRGGGGTGRSDR